MNLLLDTHVLLWFLADHPQLIARAKEQIENRSNQKFVSIASCWEIAIKTGLGKLDLGEPAAMFLPRELAINHFGVLDIRLPHATRVETLPLHHKDPFDRLLAAQALIENIPLISADTIFDQYGVNRLWTTESS